MIPSRHSLPQFSNSSNQMRANHHVFPSLLAAEAAAHVCPEVDGKFNLLAAQACSVSCFSLSHLLFKCLRDCFIYFGLCLSFLRVLSVRSAYMNPTISCVHLPNLLRPVGDRPELAARCEPRPFAHPFSMLLWCFSVVLRLKLSCAYCLPCGNYHPCGSGGQA